MASSARTGTSGEWHNSVPFWSFVALLAITFALGGGARADIQSLVVLRPMAIILCAIGLASLTQDHIRRNRWLFAGAGAILALILLHMLPLPPALWGAFPGRDVIREIDRTAALGAVWRPLSLVPAGTTNALFGALVPMAALVLGVQLDRDQLRRLLPIIIGIGVISGLIGLFQLIGDPQGPLYFYRITNNGSAVGLFSNRNHQALLIAMLFPMLAVFASTGVRSEEQLRRKGMLIVSVGVFLVPLLLVTGSRLGLIAGLIGIVCALFLYRRPKGITARKRKTARFDPRYLLAALAIFGLAAMTVIMSRAQAIQRLLNGNQADEQRLQVWGPVLDMAWKYFPVGSGIGSFVEVYQIDEPDTVLNPLYLNHAHNDVLEVLLVAGLPGLLALLVTLAVVVRRMVQVWRQPLLPGNVVAHARLGACIIALFILGSLADYPLRVPSMAVLLIVAILWLVGVPSEDSMKNDGTPDRSGLAA